MRVTNSMIANRVNFNTQSSLSRFLELQTQMSSGRRINKPSDDPIGIIRDLDYRNELSKITQYQENINQADNWIRTYDETIIQSVVNNVNKAKGAAINGADSSYDLGRPALADEVRSAIESLLDLGNSQAEGGRYLFSGFSTDVESFQKQANGFSFEGDNGIINYKIGSNSEIGVNLIGSDVFLGQLSILGEDADLNAALTGSSLLADLHNGQGINQIPGTIMIRDLNLGINTAIDLSLATDIDDVLTQINSDLIANGITNLTAQIGDANNTLMFVTTENGLISTTTPLDNINGGSGVDLSIGQIIVTDGAGTNVTVDLSSATTINDVITTFNAEMAAAGIANVTMGLNAASTGFEINDTNGVPLNLSIEETSANENVASQLGIIGDISPTLVGSDLSPTVSFSIEELGGTTAADLGILAEFKGDFVGTDLDPLMLSTTNLSDLKNSMGLTGGEIEIWQGEMSYIIDLDDPTLITVQDLIDEFNNSGLDITASINSTGKGIQIANNDTTRSFTIENVEDSGTAALELGIYGSSDMIGSFFVLANALEKDDQEAIGELLENFDLALNHVLDYQGIIGAKGLRLESTRSRLVSQELMFTQRLSEVEDADITKLIVDLSTYENNYRSSLMATAKIIQPSLLDFLR